MSPNDRFETANAVASDYINAYFTHLSTTSTRSNLAALYRPQSTCLWNEMYQARGEDVISFYQNLPYEKMVFAMKDCKVCPTGSGIMVSVMGDMDLDGRVQEGVLEVFHLEEDEKGWFIDGQILGFLGSDAAWREQG